MTTVNMQVSFTLETNMTPGQVTAALKKMARSRGSTELRMCRNRLSNFVMIDEDTIKTTTEKVGRCFDSLWSTISDTHQQWDDGEIDNATARAQCDTAVADYLGR
jgi:hypothetical protein